MLAVVVVGTVFALAVYTSRRPVPSTYTSGGEQVEWNQVTRVSVSRLKELNALGAWVSTVVFDGWESAAQSAKGQQRPMRLSQNRQVQLLEIRGIVRPSTVRALLGAMPTLKRVTFDLELSCHDDAAEMDPVICASSIETLELFNAFEGCPLLEQVLHLQAPGLKKLRVHRCNLNWPACKALVGFVREASHSLQEVDINETYRSGCDFRGIEFPQLRRMVLLKPRTSNQPVKHDTRR